MNVVHSVDAYILRSIQRRCNYDVGVVCNASILIEAELVRRLCGGTVEAMIDIDGKVSYYIDQYERSTVADIVILPYLDSLNVVGLSTVHLQALASIVNGMLEYRPFEVVPVHDEFKALAGNINPLRQQYINILADIADSHLLDDLLSQLHGKVGHFQKLSTNLGDLIRKSEYALS